MQSEFPNIRHMRVFLEAIRAGSISVAADRSALSQPAATQAITRLEKDLGTQLLIRRTRRFGTTACGALFAARAEAALAHLNAGARAALRLAGDAGRGRSAFDHLVTVAQLRTLVAIANSGSFTVAARALGLAQPSVHRAARSLEDTAGIALFTASPTGVELTAAAQALVQGVKLAQAEIRQGVEEIGRELGEDRGTFLLGSLPLARTSIVPTATHEMISATEGVQVRVIDGRYDGLLRSLREGDLDCLFGALRDPAPAEDVVQEHLFDDALAIVAHPAHPLAARRGLTIDDTLAYPWVAPPRETPAGQYLFETLRIQDRQQTPVRVVSSSLVLLRGMLAQGPYVSIISRHQVHVEVESGHIVQLDLPLAHSERAIGLTYRRDWRPTQTQAAYIDLLRKHGAAATLPAAASAKG